MSKEITEEGGRQEIGRQLREWRLGRGMSLREVAAQLSSSASTLSQIERGAPSVAQARVLEYQRLAERGELAVVGSASTALVKSTLDTHPVLRRLSPPTCALEPLPRVEECRLYVEAVVKATGRSWSEVWTAPYSELHARSGCKMKPGKYKQAGHNSALKYIEAEGFIDLYYNLLRQYFDHEIEVAHA